MSTCGIAAGATPVFKTLQELVAARNLPGVVVRQVGCAGMCSREPLVEVRVPGQPSVMYGNVNPELAEKIIESHLSGGVPVEECRIPSLEEMAVFPGDPEPDSVNRPLQTRIVMRNCGLINPDSMEEYIARDGYQALAKVVSGMSQDDVVSELEKSGLRGRGGAGFPTFMKWKFTKASKGDTHYIICNGDEGDPGAYMDRGILEADPHSVLEGLIIGGYVIGAEKGIFYIRAEYPLAVERIEKAIKQARAAGLLGKNILGTEFSFDCEVRLGAGAFVCGEETALIASVEGRRGTPRSRPPYPSQKGLWDKPTMINNVETLANVAQIILRGGDWFAKVGEGKSKGTKVFAVTGKVKYAGLMEIPMGTKLRDIVMKDGGGTSTGKPLKAIQTGGPAGGLIPESLLDTPVTYENLQQLGSMMGSGGMIVMDETDDAVELARFYLGFCVDESCGKCAPCRLGGRQMLTLLNKIADGKGTKADLEEVKKLARAMRTASLCGLGQAAPNPVMSALRYFEDEFTKRLVG
ncbi:MAG TPA: NADH-quinone oxidoreductase subunit J/K [Rhodospirillaceae bacterium]|nr:NADH-quinone oxidoreductase subunit J/K [Rhodospirillaceae bacterium]